MSKRSLQFLQEVLLLAGILLLTAAAAALIDRSVSSRLALEAFDRARAARSASGNSGGTGLHVEEAADFSVFSATRVREYEASLSIERRLPLAVLAIDRLGIRVPVLEGTDDLALNRGVGWIAGTAKPGEAGNIGIAGHRDGFFRGLKDIVVGDEVELTTLQERAIYVVDQIEIVGPEQVEVLRPRGSPSLALVTCYPFYFVGAAPQRFIVHAALDRRAATKVVDAVPRGGPRR
jgi:sortase A